MMRFLAAATVAFGILAGFGGGARAAGMTDGWANIAGTQDQCVAAAREAIQRAGFQTQRDANSAFGFRPNDGVTIRCVAERQMAVFFVYVGQGGPAEARAIYDQIRTSLLAAVPSRPNPAR